MDGMEERFPNVEVQHLEGYSTRRYKGYPLVALEWCQHMEERVSTGGDESYY